MSDLLARPMCPPFQGVLIHASRLGQFNGAKSASEMNQQIEVARPACLRAFFQHEPGLGWTLGCHFPNPSRPR